MGNTFLGPASLLKKRLWYRCFPVNFVKFLKTSFLQNTSCRLFLFKAWTQSEVYEDSNPVCGVPEIYDRENPWQWSWVEIRLNEFCRSTIPQKQFIIIRKKVSERERVVTHGERKKVSFLFHLGLQILL